MNKKNVQLFHDGGRYHIKTSPLICGANFISGFYMIMASVMKELILLMIIASLDYFESKVCL